MYETHMWLYFDVVSKVISKLLQNLLNCALHPPMMILGVDQDFSDSKMRSKTSTIFTRIATAIECISETSRPVDLNQERWFRTKFKLPASNRFCLFAFVLYSDLRNRRDQNGAILYSGDAAGRARTMRTCAVIKRTLQKLHSMAGDVQPMSLELVQSVKSSCIYAVTADCNMQ